MLWGAIGILAGIILGLIIDITIPLFLIKYTAVCIVVILDAIFGAIKTELAGEKEDEYSSLIFITGLIMNIILALGITFLGEQLGLELYLAVAVVFTFRIFTNLGSVRRSVLAKITKK